MKLFTKTTSGGDLETRGRLGAETTYDISNGTITWLSILYIVVQTIATSVGNYITSRPQNEREQRNLVLKEQNFKVQLIQRALEIDNQEDRKGSLLLLIKTGLISEKIDEELIQFIENNATPKWPQRPIETLDGYQKTAYNSSGSNQAARPFRQPTPDTIDSPTPTGIGSRPRTPGIPQ